MHLTGSPQIVFLVCRRFLLISGTEPSVHMSFFPTRSRSAPVEQEAAHANPDAKASTDKEWDRWGRRQARDQATVCEWSDYAAAARRNDAEVHMGMCSALWSTIMLLSLSAILVVSSRAVLFAWQ